MQLAEKLDWNGIKALSYGFYELVYRPVRPTRISLWS